MMINEMKNSRSSYLLPMFYEILTSHPWRVHQYYAAQQTERLDCQDAEGSVL